jgi:hypothetical protein
MESNRDLMIMGYLRDLTGIYGYILWDLMGFKT